MGEDKLVDRLVAGAPRAAEQIVGRFSDPSDRAGLLNAVAVGAAGGSRECLDLLVRLIDQFNLDRPPIRKILLDNDQADDAHQDVLIAVASSVQNWRTESSFTTWLYSVARNIAIKHLDRRREFLELGAEGETDTAARRLSSLVSEKEHVRAALAQMPDHYRQVLELRDLGQLTYAEVAERLGISIDTVKSRMFRGRAMLAALLTSDDDISEQLNG